MTGPSPPPPRPGFPASPCIDVCRLGEDGVCVGCSRTIREIVDWRDMSAEEQWQVVRSLPARRARRREP